MNYLVYSVRIPDGKEMELNSIPFVKLNSAYDGGTQMETNPMETRNEKHAFAEFIDRIQGPPGFISGGNGVIYNCINKAT